MRCILRHSLPHFDALRVRFQIPGRSPNLRRIELAASVLADTSRQMVPLGELSMWIRKLTLRLLSILTVEVHKQSHQASCDQCCARTLEYCLCSCRRTTLVKIFVEIISQMTCNSRNSRKFRPAKFKRYTVCDPLMENPSHQTCWFSVRGEGSKHVIGSVDHWNASCQSCSTSIPAL